MPSHPPVDPNAPDIGAQEYTHRTQGSADVPRAVSASGYEGRPKGLANVAPEGHNSQSLRRGIPLARLLPNMLTLMALCSGLTAIRFALHEKWAEAVLAIMIAGIFDMLDGRVARLMNQTSKFGAELDSLADLISFGVAPALVLYLWVLQDMRLGWIAVLLYVVCTALRLARFNTMLEDQNVPAFAKKFFTGLPSPGGAWLAIIPIAVVLEFGPEAQMSPSFVALWLILVGGLMVSRLPTLALKGRKIPPSMLAPVMMLVALLVAGFITSPWLMIFCLGALYFVSIPYSWFNYQICQKKFNEGQYK